MVRGPEIAAFGVVPSEDEIARLAKHVLAQPGKMTFWDRIPSELEAEIHAVNVASGLLGIALSADTVVLWFRAELIQVVEWSGDPRKNIDQTSEGRSSLHPRKSFEAWQETVRGRALPWERAIISAVREFQDVASGLFP